MCFQNGPDIDVAVKSGDSLSMRRQLQLFHLKKKNFFLDGGIDKCL